MQSLFINGDELPKKLSDSETNLLVKEMNEGITEARDKLINYNIRFVLYEVTHRFEKVNYDKKELVSIGIVGLIKAVDSYDLSKGAKFTTYAVRCIDNEILMFLRNLTKYQNIESLDTIIFQPKDHTHLRLSEILNSNIDLVMDYEKIEINQIVRNLVNQIQGKDKEIIKLYFGFYGRVYKQKEIVDKLNISQSNISKTIKRVVEVLKCVLEDKDYIELHYQSNKNNADNFRQLTIYEYFKNYTKEQVDEILTKLTDAEKNLIILKYGYDLDNPVQSKLTIEQTYEFYCYLIPKLKTTLLRMYGKNHSEKVLNMKSK